MSISLVNFPYEILEQIAQSCSITRNVVSQNRNTEKAAKTGLVDLRALSQTCRRFYQIMTPILYQAVWVLDAKGAEKLDRVLVSKPELAQRVQTISIFNPVDGGDRIDVNFLTRLPNLRHLSFVNAYFEADPQNDGEDAPWSRIWNQVIQPEPPELAPLSCLQSCVIKFRCTKRYAWSISRAWQLFLHPTLENLTFHYIQTYITPETLERNIRSRNIAASRSTPLKELHFHNSYVNPDGLAILLQYSKNLKALTMSVPYPHPSPLEHNLKPAEEYLQSMSVISSSLEFLSIWNHGDFFFQGPAFGLSAFPSLRILDIESEDIFGMRINDIGETMFKKIIPPNIELLRLDCGGHFKEMSLLKLAKRRAELCPGLRKIVFLNCGDDDPTAEEWYMILKDSGVDLVFEAPPPENGREIPDFNTIWDYLDDNLILSS